MLRQTGPHSLGWLPTILDRASQATQAQGPALHELSSADRGVCGALAGLGIVFDTLKLIACEYNAHTLSTYFGREARFLLPFLICVLLHHACSVGLFHLSTSLLSVHLYSLCFIYLRALWIYITVLAVGLAFCDLRVPDALCSV